MRKLIFLFLSLMANAQHLQVNYEIIRNTTTAATRSDASQEFKDKILEQEKVPEKYILYYADGASFFENVPVADVIHENAPVQIGDTHKVTTEIATRFPVKYYRRKGEDHYYQYAKLNDEFIYKLTRSNFADTVYKSETATISNYNCKLVEVTLQSGVILKIWYTEDIPVSAGPFTFGDFPGLILKIDAPAYILYTTGISSAKQNTAIMTMDAKLPVYENNVPVNAK